jgi:hypothetical protein
MFIIGVANLRDADHPFSPTKTEGNQPRNRKNPLESGPSLKL